MLLCISGFEKLLGKKLSEKDLKIKNDVFKFLSKIFLRPLIPKRKTFLKSCYFICFYVFSVFASRPLIPKTFFKKFFAKKLKIMRYLVFHSNTSSLYTPKPFLVKSSLLIFALVYVFLLKIDEF